MTALFALPFFRPSCFPLEMREALISLLLEDETVVQALRRLGGKKQSAAAAASAKSAARVRRARCGRTHVPTCLSCLSPPPPDGTNRGVCVCTAVVLSLLVCIDEAFRLADESSSPVR